MSLAKEVAAELRRVADCFDLHPEIEVITPDLSFWYGAGNTKDKFLATARILPRPVVKNYPKDNESYSRVSVEHKAPALNITTSIYRESVCRIIEPARPTVYDCELTLLDEDANLTA